MKKIFLLFFIPILLVTLQGHAQCTSSFNVNLGADPTIAFTNTCSGAHSPGYSWNFGDANYSSLPNPTNTYAYNGTYTVCLDYWETDTLNFPYCYTSSCQTVTIANAPIAPCHASFSFYVDTFPSMNVQFADMSNYQPYQWNWDFGDGNTSAQQNPTHHYIANATYSVCLTITDGNSNTCSFCDTISTIPCWQKVSASFTHTINNPVSFSSQCSGVHGPPIYSWDFGDGKYGVGQNTSHTYQYNGTYTVCLNYLDTLGSCNKTVCDTINITNALPQPCNAIFSYSPDSIGSGVYFTDNSSMGIIGWNWSFPGGNPSTSTTQSPYIMYSSGTYTASLTVTNQSGSTCTYSNVVHVGNTCYNTYANFTLTPNATPHVWDGVNYSLGTFPTSYSWDWGDGSPNSTVAAPSHTYSVAGWYNICLTITDGNGCGSSLCTHDTLYKHNTNSSMISVQITLANSVNETDISKYISVFPNPNSGEFTITNSISDNKYELKVLNTIGEVILEKNINKKEEKTTLNTSKGVYFLRIKTPNGICSKKLIIQ